jgi:hypothetical protein
MIYGREVARGDASDRCVWEVIEFCGDYYGKVTLTTRNVVFVHEVKYDGMLEAVSKTASSVDRIRRNTR